MGKVDNLKVRLKHIDAIFLPVTNLEQSLHWYKKHFSIKVNWMDDEPGWKAAGVGFKHGSFVLVEHEKTNQLEHIPFNIYTPDVQLLYEKLKQNGVKINELSTIDTMVCFDFKDPDGHWIGIVGGWEEDGIERGELIGPDAIFLAVKDLNKSASWYADLFNIEYEFYEGSSEYPFRYAFWNLANSIEHPRWFNLVQTEDVGPLVHIPFNIQIENIEAAYQTLLEKGIKVTDILGNGDFKHFNFIDPSGNEIGFVEGGR